MTEAAMTKHFVTFFSPSTLVAEQTTQPVDSWNVKTAQQMATKVTERYGATPYAFQFSTRERGPDDLDSHVTKRSALYYLGGVVRTIDEVRTANDPADRILLSNMECNGWDKVITTTKGWKWTQPFTNKDVLLEEAPCP